MDVEDHPFVCDLKDWEIYNLEDTYEFYQQMKFQPIQSLRDSLGQRIPGCYRATFQVKRPSDTFLNFETWGKGLVYVNGYALGRIWEIGPQQTLYVPGCWLKKGKNEILVFDIIGPKAAKSEGLSEPLLDRLLVSKPLTHRKEGEKLDLSGERPIFSGSSSRVTAGRKYALNSLLPDATFVWKRLVHKTTKTLPALPKCMC